MAHALGRVLSRCTEVLNASVLLLGCVTVAGTLMLIGCNTVDDTTGVSNGVARIAPPDAPSRMLSDDDPCYGGAGWCHIWGEASMNSAYVTYGGSGGASCPTGCLTYKLSNTLGKPYLSLVMDALALGFTKSWDSNCMAIKAYAQNSLQDGNIRYYDVPQYYNGVRTAGDAHFTPDTHGESTAAIHIDAQEITYSRQNLAYVLAHEASHILYNISQENDAAAQFWGDYCTT